MFGQNKSSCTQSPPVNESRSSENEVEMIDLINERFRSYSLQSCQWSTKEAEIQTHAQGLVAVLGSTSRLRRYEIVLRS